MLETVGQFFSGLISLMNKK